MAAKRITRLGTRGQRRDSVNQVKFKGSASGVRFVSIIHACFSLSMLASVVIVIGVLADQ